MSEPTTSVPKFGSFKPKPTPTRQDQVVVNDISKAVDDHGDRAKSRGHREHHRSRRSQSKERRSDRSKDRRTLLKANTETRQSPPPRKDEAVEIFIIDRNGDVKNLAYGSIHRYSVPPFHRVGAGGVLGAPSYIRIDRDYEGEKGIVLNDRRNFNSNRREKYIFAKIERERPRLLKIRPEIALEETAIQEVDFISVYSLRGKKRKRSPDGDKSGSDSDQGMNYRSIYSKSNAKDEPEDVNFQFASDGESSGSETGRAMKIDAYSRSKTVVLSRNVEQRPQDISAWLALIQHQDTLLRAAGDQHRITNAEIQSTADIKIHMYEKALEKARSLEDRETLLLGLMTEGTKIWEVKIQSERWEQISKDNIDSLLLWKSYLNFKQTTFGAFQYEEIRDIFVQRVKHLSKASHPNLNLALQSQIVYVLSRLTTFMRESGYTEQAVAIWQGIFEYNFFAPSVPPGEKVELFKEFWESEVPRIGEAAALGWRHFVENEGASEAADPANDIEGNLLEIKNLFTSWAAAEHTRSGVSRIPARTVDEVVEDDPFRVILVSDIEDFLIDFPNELQTVLLEAFLFFCHLPPIDYLGKSYREWSKDLFKGERLLESDPTWIRCQYFPQTGRPDEEMQIHVSSIFQTPATSFQNSPESMFSVSWFKNSRPWKDIYAGDNGPAKYDWVRHSLKQLLQTSFTEDLAEYYLAFEWQNEPKTIKKVSKSLLKQHPSSFRLYNAYAMIEWSRENRNVANSVFSAALDMSKSLADPDRDASTFLWKSWIWAYLEVMDNSSALSRLLSIESGTQTDGLSQSPFQLLKSRKYLEQRRDYNLYSGGQLRFAIIYAELLALLSYLTSDSGTETRSKNQGDITAALAGYTSFSDAIRKTLLECEIPDTSSHELFLQSSARLLYHHCRIGPFRPALLRKHLTNYLNLYPENTIFLSLYTFNESRLRIDNRIRAILNSTILTPSNDALSSRLFAIRYEIMYGTVHSARAAFEHALAAPSSKSSPGLWRLYMLYILQTPQFAGQAKEVWYRALRACPWAKELFILGFERLGGKVDFGELKNTWKVMGEKGLRVHVDLEEMFDEIASLERSGDRKRLAHR